VQVRYLVAVIALAAGVLVSPQVADPAAAALVDIPVHEYNMCGSVCAGGGQVPANEVIFLVTGANPRPWTASLNEVCLNSNQLGRMVNSLDDIGYNASYYNAISNVAGCGGTGFGNAIFAIGPRRTQTYHVFGAQDGSAERRGVTCVLNGNFGFDYWACSAHLDNSSVAEIQEDNLYNFVTFNAYLAPYLLIVGGDFNLTPGYSGFNKWRTNYDEIDEFSPYSATIGDGRKIDYIWIRDRGNMSSPYAPVTGNVSSDHHYYSGRFRGSF
jgi:hypothetical protein